MHELYKEALPFQSVLADARKKEAQSMREVTWRGERIAIRNDKCRVLIIKFVSCASCLTIFSANDIAFELNQMRDMDDAKLQLYDKLANCYNDSIKLVKDDIATVKVTLL